MVTYCRNGRETGACWAVLILIFILVVQLLLLLLTWRIRRCVLEDFANRCDTAFLLPVLQGPPRSYGNKEREPTL